LQQDRLERAMAGLYQQSVRENENFTWPARRGRAYGTLLGVVDRVQESGRCWSSAASPSCPRLAVPHVRTGMWEHSAFSERPLERPRRTVGTEAALARVATPSHSQVP